MAFIYGFKCPNCDYSKEIIFGVAVTDGGNLYRSFLCPADSEFVVVTGEADKDPICPSCGGRDCTPIEWEDTPLDPMSEDEYNLRIKDISEDLVFRKGYAANLREQLRQLKIKISDQEKPAKGILDFQTELTEKLQNEERYLQEDLLDEMSLKEAVTNSSQRMVKMPHCPKCHGEIIMKRISKRTID